MRKQIITIKNTFLLLIILTKIKHMIEFIISLSFTIVLVLLFIVFLSFGITTYNIVFKRRKGDKFFAENENPADKKEASRIWFSNQKIEELNIASKDKLNLKGYFLDNNSNKLAIILHGYHGRYYSSTTQAKIFYENGYDVFLPNNRAHDTSDGNYFTMGQKEIDDVLRWISLMTKKNPNYEIVLMGVSMGAHIAMMCADKIPDNIKCIIEDCGYGNLKSIVNDQIKRKFNKFLTFFILLSTEFVCRCHGFSLNNDVKSPLSNAKAPVLFIHGNKDNYVKYENLSYCEQFVQDNSKKEVVTFDGAEHNESKKQLKKYEETILGFVNKYIK
ncbi:MAG TPA: hypothetical protein DDW20_05070 [Firmicutes bacterium]|nr:hypothetical protein [Bacillota bacterium]